MGRREDTLGSSGRGGARSPRDLRFPQGKREEKGSLKNRTERLLQRSAGKAKCARSSADRMKSYSMEQRGSSMGKGKGRGS